MEPQAKFDVKRLIDDLGGPREVAEMTGKSRTAPYRWIEQGFINTKVLEDIKAAQPHINIDSYFIE